MIWIGIDWAEEHHDVAVMAENGALIDELRIMDNIDGVQRLHELFAEHVSDPAEVVIASETLDGLVLQSLSTAGYTMYEINPKVSNRYRDRHHLSGAKSDKADAKMLADLVRTDRQNHRPFVPNSASAAGLKVIARSHQSLIWTRQQHLNQLRSTLRQYYPALLAALPNLCSPSERDCPDAMALLDRAPTPELGRALSKTQISTILRRAGRQRSIDRRAGEIQEALRATHLEVPTQISVAYGSGVRAIARVVAATTAEIDRLHCQLATSFEQQADADIYRSLPGLGTVLGARILAEFGDDPDRFADAKSRKNYATTSPVTKASGKSRFVMARHGGNRQLGQICLRWAFAAISASPGARSYYDKLRSREKTHSQSMRALANRLVGVLHGCLTKRELYSEAVAWPTPLEVAA